MAYQVGCVPYVNARPLIDAFLVAGGEATVAVELDVPSQLARRLQEECWDAALVSSIYALTTPESHVVEGVGIVSNGPVASVRLFSKVPFDRIETLALDRSSLTSNLLARLVLTEQYGVRPDTFTREPEIDRMLEHADACVLIGDIGYSADGLGLHILDLGEAWTELTKLPFVWALWSSPKAIDPNLAAELNLAFDDSLDNWDLMVERTSTDSGWEESAVRSYFRDHVSWRVGTDERRGLAEFSERLVANGLVELACDPTWVLASELSSSR